MNEGVQADRRLVERLRAGDETAFEEFFERTSHGLYRFALPRVTGDETAAEEIVQATLCQAVTKLHTYRGEGALFTWLCTFCRHEISAHYRRRGKRGEVELTEDSAEVRAALEWLAARGEADPESQARRREVGRLVQATLDALPSHYGDALEWKYVEGLSVEEIAGRLGLGPKAAESLLTRARGAFREGWAAVFGSGSLTSLLGTGGPAR